MALQKEPRLFSIDEYMKMIESGVFASDDRIELIRGEILQMAPIGFDHDQHRILGRTDLHRRQRADEILEYCDLEPTQKIAEVPVQLREVGSLASARTALFLREYAGAVAPCYALASFQGNSIAHFLPSILTHTIHLDEICCH